MTPPAIWWPWKYWTPHHAELARQAVSNTKSPRPARSQIMLTSFEMQETSRIVEFGEAEPFADFYRAAPADFAERWGLRVEKVGSASAFILAGADITLFNRVLGLGIAEP